MKLEALKNINYKTQLFALDVSFLQTFIAHLLAGVNLVTSGYSLQVGTNCALTMATALSAIAAGLSAAKTIIRLARQMKEAVE